MKAKLLVLGVLMLGISVPVAHAKDKKKTPRGMIESMQALPCGVKQKGLNGLGAVWGSIGVTSVSSNEKLCPQYLFRTDDLEYHIRPTDLKHPVILPIGHEAEFKIKKDRMFLKLPDGNDKKTRTYQVVAMEPTKSANGEESSAYRSRDTAPPVSRPATTPPVETTPANRLPQQAINQNPPAQSPPPQN